MNVNDCFSHELGGDTLNEYIYSNVKKRVKEDFFPPFNSEDLIGGGGDVEEEEVIPNNMIKYYEKKANKINPYRHSIAEGYTLRIYNCLKKYLGK